MTAVEFLNRIYYSWYKIFHFIGYGILDGISNWIFRHLIYPIPFMKRRYAKFGMGASEDVIKHCDNTMNRSKDFMVSTWASAFVFLTSFFTLLILCNLIQYICGVLTPGHWRIEFFIIAIGAWLSCHFVLWKNDIYIGYFRDFEKESRKKHAVWYTATILLYIVLVVGFFFTTYLRFGY